MKTRAKSISLILVSALLTLMLAACGQGTKPAAPAAPAPAAPAAQAPAPAKKEPVTLRIGYIPIITAVPQLFAAQEQGFLAAEGIKGQFEILKSGADILPAVAGGSLEIGFSATASAIAAKEKGLDLMIVADGYYGASKAPAEDSFLVAASIKSPKDLEGKIVAVNALNSYAWFNTKEWLESKGVDTKKITWQELAFPNMPAALTQGSVQAASIAFPFDSIVLKSHPDKVKLMAYHILEVKPRQMVSPWFATKKWIDANPELAAGFNRAMRKAAAYVNANPEYGKKMMVDFAKTDPAVAAIMPIGNDNLGEKVDIAALQFQIDMMHKHGIIKTKIDPKSMVWAPAAQ